MVVEWNTLLYELYGEDLGSLSLPRPIYVNVALCLFVYFPEYLNYLRY